MLPEPLELKLGTSAVNSLSWSDDGEIAIAAGEEVQLLLPNRSAETRATRPWTDLRLAATRFTEEEWPPIATPGPMRGLFIGKEQKTPEVCALAWSPPGLARHERCALAVLTTNGFLALWFPGPEPSSAIGWERRLLLNAVLAQHNNKGDERELVRAFAWKPTVADGRRHRLALVTEDKLYVVDVSRQNDVPPEVTVAESLTKRAAPTSVYETIESSQHGSHLAWDCYSSGTKSDSDSASNLQEETCILHLITAGYLESWEITFDIDAQEPEVQRHTWSVPAQGPILVDNGTIFFIFQDLLQSVNAREAILQKKHPDNLLPLEVASITDWDAVSAITSFGYNPLSTHTGHSLLLLQPLSFLSHYNHFVEKESSKNAGKDEQLVSLLDNEASHLLKAVKAGMDTYSDEHGLRGKVLSRFHGLATFGPKKELAATLVSYWPSEQIVYQIKANDRTHLLLSHVSLENPVDTDPEGIHLPWQTSLESSLGPADMTDLWKNMNNNNTKDADIRWWTLVLLQLCSRVAIGDMVGFSGALELMRTIDNGKWAEAAAPPSGLNAEEVAQHSLELANVILRHSEGYQPDLVEHCLIPGCSSLLLFQTHDNAGDGAVCTGKGHMYCKSTAMYTSHCSDVLTEIPARCSLTYLSIQQPFISKRCETCNRTFLDQEKLGDDMTMVKKLLGSFKVCPHCNGKFVG